MPPISQSFEKNQAFISQVANLTPSIIAVYNIQTGKYVYINNSLKTLLGYEKEEWLEKGLSHIVTKIHPDDLPRIMKENQEAVEEDETSHKEGHKSRIVEFEYRLRHKNGEYKWLKTYGTVFDRDRFGRVLHVINISLDITTTKNTEEKLLKLTEELEGKVEERTRHAALRLEIKEALSKNGNLTEILNQCAQFIVRALQFPIVRIWTIDDNKNLNLFAGSMTEEFQNQEKLPVWTKIKDKSALKDKKAYLTNNLIESGDIKEKSWIKKNNIKALAGYPLILDNKLIGVLTLFSENEISHQTHETLHAIAYSIAYGIGRLQAQQAVINSEKKYHTIFATLTEGIILQDSEGKILAANSSAEKILGINFNEMNEQLVTKNNLNYLKEDGSHFSQKNFPFFGALETGQPQTNIRMGIVKDGKVNWILINSIPLKDDSGKTYAVASSFQDITQQKYLEKQKDEFISIASHELKTPLTTIKSFNEILQMQFKGEEKAQYYLGKMHGEIDRLTGLVNELLDVSKIQSGSLTLNKESVDIDKFLNEVIEDIQTASPTHQIIYRNRTQLQILVDKHRIYQVVINLISNAIKYSPKANKVIVSIQKKPDRVIFSVKDFGIGITKKDRRRIFDPFFQANTTIRQSHSGLGLGLHIAGEIVKRHGGTISVSSKKGSGSVFRFFLPLTVSEK